MNKSANEISVLFVCSGNYSYVPAFILEQRQGLKSLGLRVDLFRVVGKGYLGYLKNLRTLIDSLNSNQYDLVHAHFGLSGLLACLQFKVPVIITLHGSDVFLARNRLFSILANLLAKKTIVVNRKMLSLLFKKNASWIPCGVDTKTFYPMPKSQARLRLEETGKYSFIPDKKYLLFSSTYSKEVKNPELALSAVKELGVLFELVELKGYTREEVCLLMNAVDVCLLTSFSEGSPQFIKEAMACNRPIVSTNVGDVSDLVAGISGCFLVDSNTEAVKSSIKEAMKFDAIESRDAIVRDYENSSIVNRILEQYQLII